MFFLNYVIVTSKTALLAPWSLETNAANKMLDLFAEGISNW